MPTDDLVLNLREKIRNYKGKQLRIMEVCGTHTHENFRLGIRSMLPPDIRLISGPGCPVCVTPASFIDEALFLASQGASILSFGDLLRVPGGDGNLLDARARGAEIKAVYSPVDAVKYAAENPQKQIVFVSVGFETTTPISCIAVKHANKENIKNFSLLTANKTMTNAYYTLAGSADAFLYPGHVSVITGTKVYEKLKVSGISGVVAGFTAAELLCAIFAIIEKKHDGEPFALNCYTSVVTPEGNRKALEIMDELMEPCDAHWRGLGEIKGSGLKLRPTYAAFDARLRFNIPEMEMSEPKGCRCGDVLRGIIEPCECPLFGRECTLENPRGACMVSMEGACAAYYKYGRM